MGISVLIKPVSASCNLNCEYCFYRDEAEKREKANYGRMSDELIEIIVGRLFEADMPKGSMNVAFQGGEPMLAGIEYFRKFVSEVEKYDRSRVVFSLQTNGTLIDDEFAEFFHENDFLIGISLDGESKSHNQSRVDYSGKGSHSAVMHGCGILRRHNVKFNILSVITDSNADRIEKNYNFLKNNKLDWLQFIPCIGRDHEIGLSKDNWLKAELKLFDLWFSDFIAALKKGVEPPSIRFFDNLVLALRGIRPEMCGMGGTCNVQNVIEADGSIFPCDFYCTDEYFMGNIKEKSFRELFYSDGAKKFIEELSRPQKCTVCQYFRFCGGGCSRYYENGEYLYCEETKKFLFEVAPRLEYAARIIGR